jgi:class 3 adenylate cyclase
MAERMAMKSDRGVFIDLATREQVGDEYETQEANPVRLRRRTDPVLVWQIVEPLELEEKPDAQKKTEADPN